VAIKTAAEARREAFPAALATPRFVIPSHVWYGLVPRLDGVRRVPGVPDLADNGWGGLLSADEDVTGALLTIDPVLVLLNLAGYQVPEVIIGVPAVDVETPAADLIRIDMTTMEIGRGTTRAGAVPGTTPPSAHVSLWTEPRYSGAGIDLESAPPGWVRLAWSAATTGSDWWAGDLAGVVDELTGSLVAELAAARAAAQAVSDPATPFLCGLLSLYDPRTWSVPFPSDPPFDRITAGVTLFGDRLTEIHAATAFDEFLRAEIAAAPPTAADRWPRDTTDEARRQAVDDLSSCVDELTAQCLDGAVSDPAAAADFAANGWGDCDALTVTGLLLRWQELAVLDFLRPIEESTGVEIYGGYDLRRGDDDATHKYDGQVRDNVPTPLARGYVAQLRADLATLGFGPMFQYKEDEAANQTFELWLERAVREFQLYARMPNVAQEVGGQGAWVFYGEKLGQVPNPSPYTGPVCGVVNGETRALIALWLGQQLRCPIVVEARSKASNYKAPFEKDPFVHTDNVWRADQVGAAAEEARFYARDFTGHWTAGPGVLPAGQTLDLFALGQWIDETAQKLTVGPWTDAPSTTWPSAEITPDTFVGKAIGACSEAEKSTFRVIRSVAEVECLGYFDCFNAYDPGFISAGPYHWILGHATKSGTEDAELPPYFAYLKSLGGAAAQAAYDGFGVFGCGVDREWVTSGPQSPCWDPDEHKKYGAWITFEDEHGNPVVAPRKGNEGGEWFRQWHWFARFALNARMNTALRTHMWDYARLRLRDVLATAWEPQVMIADGKGGTRPATIGDFYTSERAVALLLRWHVNKDDDIFPLSTSKLVAAYDAAQASTWGDPSAWTDQQQAKLCDAFYELRPTPHTPRNKRPWLTVSLDHVYEWPGSWADPPNRGWKMPLDDLLTVPRIAGLANASTPVGKPYVVPFTVDWRGQTPAGPPTATSSDASVVAANGVAVTGASPNYTLTVTPVAGATGTTTIAVTADNGTQGGAAFALAVGGKAPAKLPAAPKLVGLSSRHRSFVLDTSPPL
jgi:hypothetical protein